MNLKEKLAAKQKELDALTEKVKSGDMDSIASAKSIIAEIDELNEAIATAEAMKAHAMPKAADPQHVDPKAAGEARAKSLGEHVARELEKKSYAHGQHFTFVSSDYGAKASTDVNVTPAGVSGALTTFDTNIVTGVRRRLTVRDLLGSESVSGTALTYYVEGAVEGSPAATAENGKLSQLHFGDPTPVTESLKKVGAFYKESDEIISDTPWLKSNLDNRALYLQGITVEDQLLQGDGTGTNLTGVLKRSGIQTSTYATTAKASDLAEAILDAATKVQLNSGLVADAVVMNPTDYETLRIGKDSNGQYYGGGYFTAEYGNGGISANTSVFGLPVVSTIAMAQGTFLIGSFKLGASVFSKGGVTVEIATTNEDDFTSDRVTIRINERLGLAVRYPAAFLKLTKATA